MWLVGKCERGVSGIAASCARRLIVLHRSAPATRKLGCEPWIWPYNTLLLLLLNLVLCVVGWRIFHVSENKVFVARGVHAKASTGETSGSQQARSTMALMLAHRHHRGAHVVMHSGKFRNPRLPLGLITYGVASTVR